MINAASASVEKFAIHATHVLIGLYLWSAFLSLLDDVLLAHALFLIASDAVRHAVHFCFAHFTRCLRALHVIPPRLSVHEDNSTAVQAPTPAHHGPGRLADRDIPQSHEAEEISLHLSAIAADLARPFPFMHMNPISPTRNSPRTRRVSQRRTLSFSRAGATPPTRRSTGRSRTEGGDERVGKEGSTAHGAAGVGAGGGWGKNARWRATLPAALYLLIRICATVALVGSLLALDGPASIECRAVYSMVHVGATLVAGGGNLLLILRTIAICRRTPHAAALAPFLLTAHGVVWGFIIYEMASASYHSTTSTPTVDNDLNGQANLCFPKPGPPWRKVLGVLLGCFWLLNLLAGLLLARTTLDVARRRLRARARPFWSVHGLDRLEVGVAGGVEGLVDGRSEVFRRRSRDGEDVAETEYDTEAGNRVHRTSGYIEEQMGIPLRALASVSPGEPTATFSSDATVKPTRKGKEREHAPPPPPLPTRPSDSGPLSLRIDTTHLHLQGPNAYASPQSQWDAMAPGPSSTSSPWSDAPPLSSDTAVDSTPTSNPDDVARGSPTGLAYPFPRTTGPDVVVHTHRGSGSISIAPSTASPVASPSSLAPLVPPPAASRLHQMRGRRAHERRASDHYAIEMEVRSTGGAPRQSEESDPGRARRAGVGFQLDAENGAPSLMGTAELKLSPRPRPRWSTFLPRSSPNTRSALRGSSEAQSGAATDTWWTRSRARFMRVVTLGRALLFGHALVYVLIQLAGCTLSALVVFLEMDVVLSLMVSIISLVLVAMATCAFYTQLTADGRPFFDLGIARHSTSRARSVARRVGGGCEGCGAVHGAGRGVDGRGCECGYGHEDMDMDMDMDVPSFVDRGRFFARIRGYNAVDDGVPNLQGPPGGTYDDDPRPREMPGAHLRVDSDSTT